jgi:hypothetical protein
MPPPLKRPNNSLADTTLNFGTATDSWVGSPRERSKVRPPQLAGTFIWHSLHLARGNSLGECVKDVSTSAGGLLSTASARLPGIGALSMVATVCAFGARATHYMTGLSLGLRVLGLVGVASSPRIPCAIRDFA